MMMMILSVVFLGCLSRTYGGITQRPNDMTAQVGEAAQFTCLSTTSGTLGWYVNGRRVVTDQTTTVVVVSGGTVLIINPTTLADDESKIECRFEDLANGVMEVSEARLKISKGAVELITRPPYDFIAPPGVAATFICKASRPEGIQWFVDGVRAPGERMVTQLGHGAAAGDSLLRIQPTMLQDNGKEIECRVEDAANGRFESAEARLVVTKNAGMGPMITSPPADQTVTPGSTALFTCKAYPRQGISWRVNKIRITAAAGEKEGITVQQTTEGSEIQIRTNPGTSRTEVTCQVENLVFGMFEQKRAWLNVAN